LIQVDERDLQIVSDLAIRAPKTQVEKYALNAIIEKWNAQREVDAEIDTERQD
jgi:hypothetical protein